jgi:hypothetical protein
LITLAELQAKDPDPRSAPRLRICSLHICPLEIEAAGFAATRVSTCGPDGSYGEGFKALFEATRLANRFDIAIKSTKGMSVTAARELAERLCCPRNLPLFILHDFDKAGLSILSTMQRDTRRYKFRETLNAIDLGLRYDDVRALNLEHSAERAFVKGSREKRRANLERNGASVEEADFLLDRRVELCEAVALDLGDGHSAKLAVFQCSQVAALLRNHVDHSSHRRIVFLFGILGEYWC